jgi:hypothetical protein
MRITRLHYNPAATPPSRVGAGAVWMGGGDACVALMGILRLHVVGLPDHNNEKINIEERILAMFLTFIKNANLALAFFLELGVLAALAYWGFQTGQGTIARIALGIGAPAVAIAVWALFGSPQAMWHLDGIFRVLLEVVFFGSAAVALFAAGQHVLGIAFAVVFVLNTVLASVLGQ